METPLYGPPSVGADSLCYCTRCKMELAHVIVSMVGDRPAKVTCKTCKSEHRYRAMASSTRTVASILRPPAPRKKALNSAAKVAELWEKKISDLKGQTAKSYAIGESFSKGDLIEHSKFGLGVVEEVRVGKKIQVLFRDDFKTLVHSIVS